MNTKCFIGLFMYDDSTVKNQYLFGLLSHLKTLATGVVKTIYIIHMQCPVGLRAFIDK